MRCDRLWRNVRLATMVGSGLGVVENALIASDKGKILFAGPATDAPALDPVETRDAARALGLAAEIGTLEAGKSCDLAIWDIKRPAELVYRMGLNPLHARIWKGL